MGKDTYRRRKEAGLCVQCGKEKDRADRVMCERCRKLKQDYARESREFYKSMGLCPKCGKNRLFGKEKECPECLAKMYEINKRSRENRNFDSKEYYRQDIERLKKEKLCRSCRKRKIEEGHTYCSICLIAKRERSRKDRMLKEKNYTPRSERPAYGLCYFCGNPIDRNGRACTSCSENVTKNLRQVKNEEWSKLNNLIFTGGG